MSCICKNEKIYILLFSDPTETIHAESSVEKQLVGWLKILLKHPLKICLLPLPKYCGKRELYLIIGNQYNIYRYISWYY